MHEETVGSKIVKWVLIGVSVLFLVVMLLLPLATVISEALRDGWKIYQAAVTDKYTVKAVLLTLEATAIAVGVNTVFGVFAALAVTKYQFRGKKVLIIDDVISTGESLHAMEELCEKAGAVVVGKMAVLAEGDAADRSDIIYLEKIPLFFHDKK